LPDVCLCVELADEMKSRSKDEFASAKRQVYLMQESCADMTRQTTDLQSGI